MWKLGWLRQQTLGIGGPVNTGTFGCAAYTSAPGGMGTAPSGAGDKSKYHCIRSELVPMAVSLGFTAGYQIQSTDALTGVGRPLARVRDCPMLLG